MTMSETKSVAAKEKNIDSENNIVAKDVTPNSKSGEGCHGGAARMQEAANLLRGKLPPSKRHPRGRNPNAHIAKCIKNKWRKSYRDIADDKVDAVLTYIDYLVENPK